MSQANSSKTRQQLADMFLDAIQSDNKLPWNQPWVNVSPGLFDNYNVVSNKKYRGINAAMLWMVAQVQGYTDPRWCTFKQAKAQGWHIHKGEKGVPIEFWSVYDKAKKKTLSFREAAEITEVEPDRAADMITMVKNYYIFNGQQMDMPPLAKTEQPVQFTDKLANDFTAAYLKNESIELREGGEAYYRPSDDSITMPPRESFVSEMAYYDMYPEAATPQQVLPWTISMDSSEKLLALFCPRDSNGPAWIIGHHRTTTNGW